MAVPRDKIIANAEKLVTKGKVEQAIKEYERLLADNPSDVNTLNRIGDLWVRINRTDEAVKVFGQIADRYAIDGFFLKSIAIYKKVNKLDPSRLEVYGQLADLYAKQGLAMEAKGQYQVLADYYQKHGDAAKALATYKKIAELDPNSLNVHVKLADLYSQNGQTADALREYDRVGKMLLKRGQLNEALLVFQKALKIDPGNVELAESLVVSLIDARDFDNAISLLRSTLDANKQNPRLVALLGKTHLGKGDLATAKRVLEQGLAANPTDPALRENLADLALREGSPDDALNVLGPLADSLAARGDASAADFLNKIIRIEPLHTPTLARHSMPAGPNASAGQAADVPVQVSAASQLPALARQTVVAASNAHAAEQQSPSAVLPSSHASQGSRVPSPQRSATRTSSPTERPDPIESRTVTASEYVPLTVGAT